ncbi:MAG: toll/interleukin-1 receptor domain-containing protein, partial [Aestuariivita sp.]|nr:toll/interleukin-1 receptor domain-containing protein [Aestuariivita sp.]
ECPYRSAASVVAYFGSPHQIDTDIAKKLLEQSVPIIPILDTQKDIGTHIPRFLQNLYIHRHCPDSLDFGRLVTAMMEVVGLLRSQRRAFISYRHNESRNAAIQLHDMLSARCFDVFLDTHKLRLGELF